jgi:hypothetical protein
MNGNSIYFLIKKAHKKFIIIIITIFNNKLSNCRLLIRSIIRICIKYNGYDQ